MTRTTLITGGAKRLGRVIALELAARGHHIALHYNHSRKEAEKLQADIRAGGGVCELFQADLQDFTSLAPLVEAVRVRMPGVNGLVNNASIFKRLPLGEADEASFDENFALHVKAPAFLCQAFARHASEAAPFAVVNVLDSKVTQNRHGYFFYLLSKKSLWDFTRMAALALGPNVRVNAVCPGSVMDSVDGVFGDDHTKREARTSALQRPATPEEVAGTVAYLLETPGLTGQALFVDGGMG